MQSEEPTCCHCQGKHPANYIGWPNNPLNRPPPPPKVNFWQERARKKKMLEAAKAESNTEAQPQKQVWNTTQKIHWKLRIPALVLFTALYSPNEANVRTATIDFGISYGLDDILVETHSELSSDHNPIQFIIPSTNNRLYAQNCTTFTNWNLFQESLHSTIPGNPKISNANEIDEKIAQFTSNIHSAINQSSKVKVIKHNIIFIPRSLRTKIAEKNRLRKQWQATRSPPSNKKSIDYSGKSDGI
ncbi:RNA-directed DNA polymerase from mobile element jockey [Trichonephila clavipes]|nr:RNA-directed DNA polymerase from mobile element jockey [Trichonephila clavipes]